jgi:hypothetical protein
MPRKLLWVLRSRHPSASLLLPHKPVIVSSTGVSNLGQSVLAVCVDEESHGLEAVNYVDASHLIHDRYLFLIRRHEVEKIDIGLL